MSWFLRIKGILPSSKKGTQDAREIHEMRIGSDRIWKNGRLWLRLPPTSTILHSVPVSLPAPSSISNLYSDTPTVFSLALRTSSSEGRKRREVTRSMSSRKL